MKSDVRAVVERYRQWPNLYYYARGKIALDPAYHEAAKILSGSDLPLLDLGCGMGLLALLLIESGYAGRISGVDVDESKIAIARQVLPKGIFHGCSALDFPEHLGNVIMLDVLHYFSDAEQQVLLDRIASSIAPGGVALIRVTLNEPSWRFACTKIEEWFVHASRWIPVQGWNFPHKEEILAPFQRAGLEAECRPMWGWTPFNSYLFTVRRSKS